MAIKYQIMLCHRNELKHDSVNNLFAYFMQHIVSLLEKMIEETIDGITIVMHDKNIIIKNAKMIKTTQELLKFKIYDFNFIHDENSSKQTSFFSLN